MTNYIEIIHEYRDDDSDLNFDTYYAVSPTPSQYSYDAGDGNTRTSASLTSWDLMGGKPVSIYGQEDIDGLRKLLDVIEVELKDETS